MKCMIKTKFRICQYLWASLYLYAKYAVIDAHYSNDFLKHSLRIESVVSKHITAKLA